MLPRSKDVTRPYAYISEPLTGRPDLEEIKKFCLQIGQVCQEAGLYPYLPFQHSDPVAHRDIPPSEVFAADKDLTQGAKAVVFYLPGDPSGSFGVGSEMVFAATAKRPIAMMIRQGTTLSLFEKGFIDVEIKDANRGPIIEINPEDKLAALTVLSQFLRGLNTVE